MISLHACELLTTIQEGNKRNTVCLFKKNKPLYLTIGFSWYIYQYLSVEPNQPRSLHNSRYLKIWVCRFLSTLLAMEKSCNYFFTHPFTSYMLNARCIRKTVNQRSGNNDFPKCVLVTVRN